MLVATTRRETHHPQGPVRHVRSGQRVAGPRSSEAALCGASVPRLLSEDFDPAHPRACSTCAKIESVQP